MAVESGCRQNTLPLSRARLHACPVLRQPLPSPAFVQPCLHEVPPNWSDRAHALTFSMVTSDPGRL